MPEISSTADQMLELLETIARSDPMSTAQLAQKTGINRTAAHRLITTLHRRGYVLRERKAYILGPRLALLLNQGRSHNITQIVDKLRPLMSRLSERVQETVILHYLDGREAIVMAQAIAQQQLVRVQHIEGSRHDLTLGASGRVLLAFQTPKFIAQCLKNNELQAKLNEIKQAGIAMSENELQDGVIGMAVPLYEAGDRVRFSLALLAPQQRASNFHEHKQALIQARQEMEALLSQP